MHLAPLIQDLAVILGVAAVVTFVFRLIRQPLVLGYIAAGIIVGPYTPPVFSVVDVESVKTWAELGVIFLMFALGLEFSFRRLARVGVSSAVTASIEITAMVVIGYIGGRLLGWNPMNAVFLGAMVAISSTTIIIKTFEELGLKGKRMAELVCGILIVEDLAAVIFLVALANIATKADINGIELLAAGGKLVIVVGAWLVVGLVAVPRFVRAVGRQGSNEMMLVVSLGLCLALVSISAYFDYSVALGAFLMGSIIAETKEAHRIESLVAPLKDVFGAVFFVSVGMLLDPKILIHNLPAIALISLLVIVGKVLAVTIGALATGQSLPLATQSGFSMAQIGEFSFIIATLGVSHGAIDEKVYPIIVAVSLLTTFTTPYLVQAAPQVAGNLEQTLPESFRRTIVRYSSWFQRLSFDRFVAPDFYLILFRWVVNALVVTVIFVVSAVKLIPVVETWVKGHGRAHAIAWLITFLAASPFIWAMFSAFRRTNATPVATNTTAPIGGSLIISRVLTVMTIGVLSSEFFAVWLSVLVTVTLATVVFFVFRRQIENYYGWFEARFIDGIAEAGPEGEHDLSRLAPWDAHLVEIPVAPSSRLVGKTLVDLQLRERFGANIVVIRRAGENIVAPAATHRVYPGDILLCFGTDSDLERFRHETAGPPQVDGPGDLSDYDLRALSVSKSSIRCGLSIRQSGIREEFDCLVVGLERQAERIQNPKSDISLEPGDLLWVIGTSKNLARLRLAFQE